MYVRALLTEPGGVPIEVEETFCALYSPDEREYVVASMKGMFCTTWRGLLPSGGDACALP